MPKSTVRKLSSAKTLLAGACLLFSVSSATFADVKLQGSGASFPFPIYSKWFKDFSKQNSDVRVDYQAKGSGGGIQDFTNGVVDFAGSDAAMDDTEISKVKNGVVLLPVTAGEIVLTYNLDGIKDLKLSRDVYPEIFSGKITKWNDPRIAKANPGTKLPDKNITVVVRADSSGTTYVFTGHLATINKGFKDTVGFDKAPQWPQSNHIIKSPKNDGITATVKQTPGSIGYIEYGYAKLTGMPSAQLENKAGKFVSPGPESGAAALASAQFPTGNLPGSSVPDLRAWIFDPAGEAAYPIASFTWLMFPEKMNADKLAASMKLIEYGITEGQKVADSLGYIPLPENVVSTVRTVAKKIQSN
jgi:phosphate transport system substrate-binding protein